MGGGALIVRKTTDQTDSSSKAQETFNEKGDGIWRGVREGKTCRGDVKHSQGRETLQGHDENGNFRQGERLNNREIVQVTG